ncbi:MAG: hypothetical protein PUC23_05040 [bacterium]|nr:hypothetical protein [bacterium]
MKKIIYSIFLISVFSLTGCTSNFDVSIKDEMIIQNVSISMNNNEITKETVAKTLEDLVLNEENDSEFLGYFTIIGNKKSNPLNANINYNVNNYDFDYALSFCYDNQNITYNNNILTISANNFNCFQKYNIINNININVTTGYKVLEHNADSVNDNTYTWNITKSSLNKNIKLKLDTTVDEIKQNEEQKQENKKNIMVIVGVAIGSLLLGLVIAMYIMYQKNNKI